MTKGAETTADSAVGIWWRKGLVSMFAVASDSARMAKTYVLPAARNGTVTEVFAVP